MLTSQTQHLAGRSELWTRQLPIDRPLSLSKDLASGQPGSHPTAQPRVSSRAGTRRLPRGHGEDASVAHEQRSVVVKDCGMAVEG